MTKQDPVWAARRAATLVLLLSFVLGLSTASASRDRTAPTMPTNFRVTARTSYTVSLAWNASTDDSGQFSYVLVNTTKGQHVALPSSATSYVWNTGLLAGYSYTFSMYAVDAAGNQSRAATVTTTLPADRTAPGAPVLSVSDVGATYVSLTWTRADDDGSYLTYQVFVNDDPPFWVGFGTVLTVTNLEPETIYTFRVQARDNWNNFSLLSNTVTATTEPRNTSDTTPPTMPGNLRDNGISHEEETWLFWDQSTDNLTPQSLIEYEVYLNGVLQHTVVGRDRTILYGTAGIVNEFQVIAVDEAGNTSPAATFIRDLR